MKLVYWRPQKTPKRALLLVAVLSLGGLAVVESSKATSKGPYYAEKVSAARLAKSCMDVVREARGENLSAAFDPDRTGMVGQAMSVITSRPAELEVKQKSTDPNFAAVFVELLKAAGVGEGDIVAVGWSGSFPGFNTSLCAALETLKARPVVIASVMASQYGANDPQFVWLDMERVLAEHGLISFRSAAATIGGPADRGLGMTAEAIEAARDAMCRSGVGELPAERLQQSIDARMHVYQAAAAGTPIAAYVNVGGGIASTGGAKSKRQYHAGLSTNFGPSREGLRDCVMRRFLEDGTPVIHLVEVQALAKQFGLDYEGDSPVGAGGVFATTAPNRWIAAGVLLVIGFALRMLVLTDLGHQIWQDVRRFCRPSSCVKTTNMRGADAGPRLMA